MINLLYMLGTFVFWFGAIAQIERMLTTQSVHDLAFSYVLTLVVGHALLFPRTLKSPYWVWKIGVGVSLFLSLIICGLYLVFI